ncbi:hypothetical protein J6590_004952 [Homalodisca vitripennis]|nr:hypothetical protein J6590_004952 [Homalodisca vitripennis]
MKEYGSEITKVEREKGECVWMIYHVWYSLPPDTHVEDKHSADNRDYKLNRVGQTLQRLGKERKGEEVRGGCVCITRGAPRLQPHSIWETLSTHETIAISMSAAATVYGLCGLTVYNVHSFISH